MYFSVMLQVITLPELLNNSFFFHSYILERCIDMAILCSTDHFGTDLA